MKNLHQSKQVKEKSLNKIINVGYLLGVITFALIIVFCLSKV